MAVVPWEAQKGTENIAGTMLLAAGQVVLGSKGGGGQVAVPRGAVGTGFRGAMAELLPGDGGMSTKLRDAYGLIVDDAEVRFGDATVATKVMRDLVGYESLDAGGREQLQRMFGLDHATQLHKFQMFVNDGTMDLYAERLGVLTTDELRVYERRLQDMFGGLCPPELLGMGADVFLLQFLLNLGGDQVRGILEKEARERGLSLGSTSAGFEEAFDFISETSWVQIFAVLGVTAFAAHRGSAAFRGQFTSWKILVMLYVVKTALVYFCYVSFLKKMDRENQYIDDISAVGGAISNIFLGIASAMMTGGASAGGAATNWAMSSSISTIFNVMPGAIKGGLRLSGLGATDIIGMATKEWGSNAYFLVGGVASVEVLTAVMFLGAMYRLAGDAMVGRNRVEENIRENEELKRLEWVKRLSYNPTLLLKNGTAVGEEVVEKNEMGLKIIIEMADDALAGMGLIDSRLKREYRAEKANDEAFGKILDNTGKVFGVDTTSVANMVGNVVVGNPKYGLHILRHLVVGKHWFDLIPTADGLLGFVLRKVYEFVLSAVRRLDLDDSDGSKYRKAVFAVVGLIGLFVSVPLVAEVVGTRWLTSGVIWLGRGLFATQSRVNVGHLGYVTGGLRMTAGVLGRGSVSNMLRVVPNIVRGGDTAARAGLWALGTGVYSVLYGGDTGSGTMTSLMSALEPHDAVWNLFSGGGARKGMSRRALQMVSGVLFRQLHPFQILRYVWTGGYTGKIILRLLGILGGEVSNCCPYLDMFGILSPMKKNFCLSLVYCCCVVPLPSLLFIAGV